MSLSSQPEESENENCASAGGMVYLTYESIFVYFLKLLYGLKYNVKIISSKNSDVKMMVTDLQAA